MAIRKQKLQDRVFTQQANHVQAMGDYHPFGTPATPMTMPTVLITVTAGPLITADGAPVPEAQAAQHTAPSGSAGYMPQTDVTLGVSDVAPLITADGAVIPATAPGRWDQLRMAGGGRYG